MSELGRLLRMMIQEQGPIDVGRYMALALAHPEHGYEEHVIVSMRQSVVDRSYETNSNDPEYSNSFEAVPSRVPMTPHRATKRPRIEGTQVAIVAGPAGEEIHPQLSDFLMTF